MGKKLSTKPVENSVDNVENPALEWVVFHQPSRTFARGGGEKRTKTDYGLLLTAGC